ncbi:hypothetical protein C3K47_05755 [Solitalea longa]|uniref:Secretion system C-terminal sorting domain-containing protein n=1 Tax=Solitalea longa TaxID=2079460 RepID=A0A2S5A620_9SPHI|nr:T9SS type A sorting domain-containing protein [Solitalea longa]POY38028.1 hypothetical protein C3K47_05755 [Solitalea longa]
MKSVLCLCLGLLFFNGLKAQVSVRNPDVVKRQIADINQYVFASGGGFSQTSDGVSLQYCIGEPIIQTLVVNSNSLTQGFEQPHLLSNRFTELLEVKGFDLVLYPNPTNFLTKVKFVLDEPANVRVEVLDQLGRILSTFSKKYERGNVEIPIDVKHLAVGGYYVEVYINNNKYERALAIE